MGDLRRDMWGPAPKRRKRSWMEDIARSFMTGYLPYRDDQDVPVRRYQRGLWVVKLDRAHVGNGYYLRAAVAYGDKIMAISIAGNSERPATHRRVLSEAIAHARKMVAKQAAEELS